MNHATKIAMYWAVTNCQYIDEDVQSYNAEQQLMPLSMMLAVLFHIDRLDDCKPALHNIDWAYVTKRFKEAE